MPVQMKKSDCVFCKIVEGSLPSRKVLETEKVFAFHDLHPQAPVHVLIVPKTHLADLSGVAASEAAVFQDLFQAAQKLALELGISDAGFRTVFNTGKHACQTVFHLHLHLLGGAQLGGSMVG